MSRYRLLPLHSVEYSAVERRVERVELMVDCANRCSARASCGGFQYSPELGVCTLWNVCSVTLTKFHCVLYQMPCLKLGTASAQNVFVDSKIIEKFNYTSANKKGNRSQVRTCEWFISCLQSCC